PYTPTIRQRRPGRADRPALPTTLRLECPIPVAHPRPPRHWARATTPCTHWPRPTDPRTRPPTTRLVGPPRREVGPRTARRRPHRSRCNVDRAAHPFAPARLARKRRHRRRRSTRLRPRTYLQ